MQNIDDLEMAFHERMRQIYEQAKEELGYIATRFINKVNADGGLVAAKGFLMTSTHSEGLTRLWEEGRLDISVEATVLREPWRHLFTDEELANARRKLEQLGYEDFD